MHRVLVTRPEDASRKLASELKGSGFEVVAEPLLTIEALPALRPQTANLVSVMLTSQSALDALTQMVPSLSDHGLRNEPPGQGGLRDLFVLPCFCVGQKTAERATAFGFQDVRYAGSDSLELARLIATDLKGAKGEILHISGRHTDSKASDELMRLAFDVVPWHLYEAKKSARLSRTTVALLRDGMLDAVLVYSVRTAETLISHITKEGLQACCARLCAIGLSRAVSDALEELPWKKLLYAVRPTEDAMIESLKQLRSVLDEQTP